MENYNVYAARLLPTREEFVAGHRACQGCGLALAVRLVHKALGPNTIACNSTGCLEIISSSYPDTAWDIPWIHVAFENSASVASGAEAGLKALMRKGRLPQKDITVVAMGGDGSTTDIGLQFVSGAMERGHNMIYVCYDNEAYMNTGIQRSGSTPYGAATTTSPAGKLSVGQQTWKKSMMDIIVAHRVPYAATINPSYPFDLFEKVKKAASIQGPTYLHAYAACPTGWRSVPAEGIMLCRLAVECGVFPMYEVENGQYKISKAIPPENLRPLKDYLKRQGRFRHLDDATIDYIEQRTRKEYRRILALSEFTSSEQ